MGKGNADFLHQGEFKKRSPPSVFICLLTNKTNLTYPVSDLNDVVSTLDD